MKPSNQAERSSAFVNFLLLFSVTIALVVAVIFFSIKVPFRQNEQLRQRMADMQNEREFSDAFTGVLKEAVDELNKIEERKEPLLATAQRVQFRVDRMNRLIKEIPDEDNSIYALVAQTVEDLNNAKVRIRRLEEEKGYTGNQ